MGPSALVSIVIPAYKATFFEAALQSAFAQDYPAVEIVIGDDCPTNAIGEIVKRLEPESPWPINYARNDVQLREAPNVTSCVRRARGKYIKFLYDDDLLKPNCISRQVEILEGYPGLSLVTARRQLIDEHDSPLPDTYATRFPFAESMRVHGQDFTSFLGEYTFNFIGEPTSVLCRRADLIAFGDSIFGLDDQHISWLGDLAIYVKLMRQGDIAMLNETLTLYRVSSQQSSEGGRNDSTGPAAFHKLFRRLLSELGWVRPSAQNTHVRTSPLALNESAESGPAYDLAAWLHSVLPGFAQPDFMSWLDKRQLGPVRRALIDNHVRSQGGGPALLILISDMKNEESALFRTLTALDRQAPLLSNATVVVLSTRPGVGSGQVERGLYWVSSNLDERVGHINQLISEVSFDWLIHMDAGVQFNRDALSVALLELLGNPACPGIFCDEVYVDTRGGLWPVLRSNFNFDQLLSVPAGMAGHWLFRRDALLAVDGFDNAYPGAFELDLILRLIEAGQQGFGHISEPLTLRRAETLETQPDERRALSAHLARRGYVNARVIESTARHYDIDYAQETPSVALIIPVREPLDNMKRCVASVLMNTKYDPFHVLLVETQDTSPSLLGWMEELEEQAQGKVLSLRSAELLSTNSAMNGAVEACNDDYIAFLDPACVVVEEQWLNLMIDQAMRPEIGAVTARRVERGERFKDAGVRLGLEGPAETALYRQDTVPLEYIQAQRNVIGFSRDCLVISKLKFKQVGGFDELRFTQRWADVDLSLKLHWAGYLNLWTPRAWVALTEPVRRFHENCEADVWAMYAQWGGSLGKDPSGSQLYALRGNGFDFDKDPQVLWRPMSFAGLPVVVAKGQPGEHDYRISKPLETLRMAGRLEGGLVEAQPLESEWLRLMPGTIVLTYGMAAIGASLHKLKTELSPCTVCDLSYASDQAIESANLHLELADFDRVLVATPDQAKRVEGMHSVIEVIPSLLPPTEWRDLPIARSNRQVTRVGCVCVDDGAVDLSIVSQLLSTFRDVEWVFYGKLPESLREDVKEFHPSVEAHRYPYCLAKLELDVAIIAPMASFSSLATSEHRVLEHGACGSAVISSQPSAWPVITAAHTVKDLANALRQLLDDPLYRQDCASRLHETVMARGLLEGDGANSWLSAWRPLDSAVD
ncbi:glycosyltransferase [Pseudomonas sp. DC3000-4b1]|uniref:glycosyltransferase n=1 Tax=unclassified Pseudomonas TaxID=196821 RepID=UPI003CE6BE7B